MDSKLDEKSNGGSPEKEQVETSLINIIRTSDNRIKLKSMLDDQMIEDLLRSFFIQYERRNIIQEAVKEMKKEQSKTRIIRP